MKENKKIQDSIPEEEFYTESTGEDKSSIPKPDRNGLYVFLFFLVLVLVLGFGYYYYYRTQTPQYSELSPDASIKEKLNYNPKYLEEENLLIIKGMGTIEYLRTRLLYHRYETKGDPLKNTLEELGRDFNGERAQVLSDILTNYSKYTREKEKLDSDSSVPEYKKLEKLKSIRVEIFGEEVEGILFPEKPEDRLEKFFSYSKYYLKNHYEDDPLSKRDHLLKAKKEIYGDYYEELSTKEPFPRRLELELGIEEREMSILTEEERRVKIESIREKLRKD